MKTENIRPYGKPVGQLVMAARGDTLTGMLAGVRSMSQPQRPARVLPAPNPSEVIA
ncbi:hypothetical protein GAR05_06274 [Micromonospora saelicesensis]|uniref:Uncharacterized protein n=1 Tax=Micromonospora saelicesensis TaxID=285676 RepID=A0ABX9C9G5_9ACTN|nr:hypothetical protein [Micromonospora saelicesensis]RAN92112.1 hypothetical protein GAR05_06274 [Micromonospora saelicesensis]